jgi:hypothetical protein
MIRLTCATLLVVSGAAAAQSWQQSPAIFLSPVVPPGLKLLSQPAVQTDVSLTAGQKAEVVALNRLWDQSPRAWETALVGPEVARAAVAQLTQEFLTKGLTKEQRTRLDQIVFQLREKEFGAYAAFAMASRDLGLRADQVEDVQNLKGLRVEDIAKHVTSGERFERVKAKVAATNDDTFEKMTEMLTRTQRERLKEMRGKPFTGSPEAIWVEAKMADFPKFVYPPQLFGVYDFEVRYLGSIALWREVGIQPNQRAAINRALREWDDEYFRIKDWPVEKVADLHDRTAKGLDSLLTPTQRKRFDELMARRRREVGGLEAACGYPAVVSALRLTPIQLNALRDGKPAGDVLTKNQFEALERLFGEPPDAAFAQAVDDPIMEKVTEIRKKKEEELQRAKEAQNLRLPDFAFARNFVALANRLKLSEDQIKKLRELAEDEPKIKALIQRELSLADTPPVAGSARGLTTMTAVMDQYQIALEEQCWSVLDAQQQSTARKIFGRGR